MTWYQILGVVWILISMIAVISLMMINKNKKTKQKKMGKVSAFLGLASMAILVGVGINSMLSLLFYAVAILFNFIATFLAVKVNREYTANHSN